jgi:hypothetical protein
MKQPSQPPPSWQSASPQAGLVFRPAGVQDFPATLGEVEPWDDLSFTASKEPVPAMPASPPARLDFKLASSDARAQGGTPVEAAYTPAVPATVREIHTFCTREMLEWRGILR